MKNDLPFMLAEPVPAEEVGYARVSDKDDQDPDFQIALLKKRGIPDGNIFVDMASGRSMRRAALRKALMLMEGRRGWTLVVYKLDRLGRDALGLMELAREFDRKGWNLVSITEQIDTRTPMVKCFFGILALMAQLESDLISERTRAGVARRKERGFPVGRRSKLTPAQWVKLEADLLKRTDLTIIQVAEKYGVTPGSVQNHFPAWRGKTQAQRDAHRKRCPLPQQ